MENNYTTDNQGIVSNDQPVENQSLANCCPQLIEGLLDNSQDNKQLRVADREEELAILFLDIRNFSSLMESRPAMEVIQVVRRLFTVFNGIVGKFKGKVVETAGDSLYAVFGLQTSIRDAAAHAFQSAKLMFETLNMFNEAYAVPYYNNPLEIGIGMHAGNVVVGQFGLDERERLTVMGLPVNIAARLQAATKQYNNDMVISEEAYSLLGTDESGHERRTVSLHGLSSTQNIRLVGKPYAKALPPQTSGPELDWLLAISG